MRVKLRTKPFIKKFKIGKNYYIYDVNTNAFFEVSQLVYMLVDKSSNGLTAGARILKKFPGERVEEVLKDIASMKAEGFFSSHRPGITFFHTVSQEHFKDYLKGIHSNRLPSITLVITENCNLRCRYCSYSGKYKYRRKHSRKIMSRETMRKAVDFYFARSKAARDGSGHISFYGGEPLLNLSLIKECIAYVKHKYPGEIHFGMTLNGTLLNKKTTQFLVENGFRLLISVDGPKEIHNRNRIYRNGKGSFDSIMKNLREFKRMYPQYYKENVRFHLVISPPFDFGAICEFLFHSDVMHKNVRFSSVIGKFTSYFDQFDREQIKLYNRNWRAVLDSFNNKLSGGEELNEVEKSLFRKKYLSIHRRDMNKLPAEFPSNGQCVVGERSLTVNVNGSFTFCTMTDDVFNLGSLEAGFDYKAIEKIYFDLDRSLSKQCYGCWAIRFCSKCIRHIDREGRVDQELLGKFCTNKKRAILNEIKDYIRIREKNEYALGYLDDVGPT